MLFVVNIGPRQFDIVSLETTCPYPLCSWLSAGGAATEG